MFIVFPFRHNYNTQIKEDFEFLTEIQESDNGYEQIIDKRMFPRHSFNQDVVLVKGNDNRINAQLISYYKSVMIGWQDKVFCVGRWQDQTQLQTDLLANSSFIAIDTIGRAYEVGSFLMLWKDEFNCQVVKIESLSDNSIVFTEPLNLTWQAYSTKVLPAKLARVSDSYKVNLITKTVQSSDLQWNTIETLTDTARLKTEVMTTYRNYPVMMRKNNNEDDNQTYQHKIAIADSQIGVRYFDSLRSYAPSATTLTLASNSRTDFAKLLYLFYELKGSSGALWIPSWEFDIHIIDSVINAGSIALNIEYIGYSRYRINKNASLDIMILMRNGDVYYRRIVTAFEANDQSSETIVVDTALHFLDIQVADIERISFLTLCRSSSDSFSLDWISGDGKALFNFELIETNEAKIISQSGGGGGGGES